MAVTEQQVKDLLRLGNTVSAAAELATAQNFVTLHLTGQSLSQAILDDITKYYAAHLVAMSLPEARIKEFGLGPLRKKYMAKDGEGIQATTFGQVAAQLDPTGTLGALDTPRAEFRTIGSG